MSALRFSFTVLFSLLLAANIFSQWNVVGSAGFTTGSAGTPSIDVAAGVPYIGYIDGSQSTKMTVQKYNGSAWEVVGSAGFSPGGTDYTKVHLIGGVPYAAFKDYANSEKATVMKFNGSSWEYVGSAGFSSGVANYISLSSDGTNPYVAYQDAANSNKITVQKFNGSSWSVVGTAGISTGTGVDASLFVYNTTPYVAFKDEGVGGGKAVVKKFNGSAWVNVGTSGFSAGVVNKISLVVSNDTAYVAYSDMPNGEKATVMKYNGSAWVTVGVAGFTSVYTTNLAFDVNNGVPVVSYRDASNSNKVSTMIFNGSKWKRAFSYGYSSGYADNIAMKISNGVSYVVLKDFSLGNKASVYSNANLFAAIPNYTISGSAGVSGATLTYSDDSTYTVISDGSGNYSYSVPAGWSGNLIASKLGYTFSPASISFSNVSANSSGNNFAATLVYTPVQPSGAGTSQSPYLIANLSNLFWMALSSDQWDKHYLQTANIDAASTSGWYSGAGFPLIGNLNSAVFTGTYNGGGYTISNLHMNNTSQMGCGFISIMMDGTIQNTHLKNVSITGSENVGGLSGYALRSTITNCSVTGSITATGQAGGLIGSNDSGSVTTSKAFASVTSSGTGVGGLLGYNSGSVQNSAVFGPVHGSSIAGGFIGLMYAGTITNCYATGKVTSSNSGALIAGFAGTMTGGTISKCYSNGWVSPLDFSKGFLGYSFGGTVTNCFWNTQTSGRGASAAGTGKTTTEMRTQSTFTAASWDFTTTWTISAARNFGSPALQGITLDSVSLSGNTDTSYVLLSYTDNSPKTVTSDGSGNYSFNVIFGWVGTITPTKSLFSFSPTVYTINGVGADSTGINFITEELTSATPSGSGTEGDPFVIANFDNLVWLSEKPSRWNAYFVQSADIDASVSNTLNGGAGFSPIGKMNTQFTGQYDGRGHTILSLYISRTSADTIAMFGAAGGSSVLKNIRLVDVTINAEKCAAALVAYFDGDSILNCYSSGAVACSLGYEAGGLIYANIGGYISGSYSECNVVAQYGAGGFASINLGTITNCYAAGTISYGFNIAGFIYYNQGTVSNCYSRGLISGISSLSGFCSLNSGTITSSYWDTQTSGTSSSSGGTGKTTAEMKTQGTFTGWNFTSPWSINAIVNNNYPYIQVQIIPGGLGTSQLPYVVSSLNHLYWISTTTSSWSKYFSQTADINASATSSWNSGSGFSPIGTSSTKFTGSYDGNGHTISNLFISRTSTYIGLFGNTSSAASITDLGISSANITGRTYTGALVGLNEGNISGCYSTGSIKIAGSYSHLGGLTGRNQGTITDSYSTAACSSGSTIVGGFTGSNTATITRCFSTGSVTGSGTLGGLIGQNTGLLVTNSFWDNQTSGRSTSAAGTGKSTGEMKTQSTFLNAGWSFTTWNMGDGINDGYPYLKWQNPAGTALPVELENFSATLSGGKVHLNWTTAVEVNNFGFEIQRAAKSDSIYTKWEKIGFIAGNGNTNVSHAYSFRDILSQPGSYAYRLKQIDADGSFSLTEPVLIDFGIPVKFELYQNYPNPFNPSTKIRYDIPVASQVRLDIFTILGDKVLTVVDEMQQPGSFTADLNMSGYPSGTYLCRLTHNSGSSVIKLMLIK